MKSTNIGKSSHKEIPEILLKIKAITLSPDAPYRFVSGVFSPIYTDNRLLISYPKERKKVIKYLVDKIKKVGLSPDVIAGTATAGIPHAAWVAEAMKLPMIYVRSEPKSHGKGKQIEGLLKKGQKVVVIEDLISSGGSSLNTVEIVRKNGGKVKAVVAIFDYQMPISGKSFANSKVKLFPLITLSDLVLVASKKGYLEPKNRQIVLGWANDPQNWGKKMGFE